MPLESIFGRIIPSQSDVENNAIAAKAKEELKSNGFETQRLRFQVHDQTVHLDVSALRASAFKRIIESSIDDRAMVHLEVDSATKVIQKLQVPFPTYVDKVEPRTAAESNNVQLFWGTGVLKSSNPRYSVILAALLASSPPNPQKRIWLVAQRLNGNDPSAAPIYEIVDAFEDPDPPSPEPGSEVPELDDSQLVPISIAKCNDLFDYLSGLDTPNHAPANSKGTIPFRFVEHGCEARAHEVCRILMSLGIRPTKVWAFGADELLNLTTDYHPDCTVQWGFHVAAAVQTVSGVRILDPSIESHPMTLGEFRTRFDNDQIHVEATGPEVYLMTQSRTLFKSDYSYIETRQFISAMNRAFELMLAYFPPPPYDHCSRNPAYRATRIDLVKN